MLLISAKLQRASDLLDSIFKLLGSVAQIVADWPARKAESARKSYANWKAGVWLRKEVRARRAANALDDSGVRPQAQDGPK